MPAARPATDERIRGDRRASEKMPMPAGCSAPCRSFGQPHLPNASSVLGSPMPRPSSLTVLRRLARSCVMANDVAPDRRAFWRMSWSACAKVPSNSCITLVSDNLNTHTKGAFYEVFERARARQLVRRIEFYYTPKHGSWLNIAENELSAMTRQCLRGRRIGDLGTLHGEVSAWSTDVNGTQRGVDWQMKVDDARCKLKSVYPKIMT